MQKIDASGVMLGISNGIAICTASGNQEDPQLCINGANSAIITWEDGRGANVDIYAQSVEIASTEFPWYLLLLGQGEEGLIEFLVSPLGLFIIIAIGLVIIVSIVVYKKRK